MHQAGGALETHGGDAGAGELLEAALAAEGVRLAAVEGHHPLVGGEAGERRVDDTRRDPLRFGVARHAGEKGIETTTALGGESGSRDTDAEREGQERAPDHTRTSSLSPKRREDGMAG